MITYRRLVDMQLMDRELRKEFELYVSRQGKRQKWARTKSFLWYLSFKLTNLCISAGQNKEVAKMCDKKIYNIGCGKDIIDGTISFDTFDRFDRLISSVKYRRKNKIFPINILKHDKNLENTAEGILLNHVLEHLDAKMTLHALITLRSILCESGTIRISVPSVYTYTSDNTSDNPQKFKHNIIALNNLFYSWGHKFMFSEGLLINLLSEAGYSNVRVCSHGNGVLGKFDSEHRRFESIYVEGSK